MSAVLDFPVKPEARDYLARFARDAGEPEWLAARRQQAMTRFAELGFPSRKSENWRYLDLQPLARRPLLPTHATSTAAVPAELGFDRAWLRVVLLDGACQVIVRRSPVPEGVWIAAMRRALVDRPALVSGSIEQASGDASHPFAALNTAFFSDGFVLDVAAGAALDAPIEIVHFGSGGGAGSLHTRSLINLGEGSRASIVEIHAGDGRYWRNDVVVARLARGAGLRRTVVVEEATEAVHLAQLDATLAAEAALDGFALLLGGSRARQEWNVRLAGDGARCRLDAAYVVDGNDEANIVTAVDHAATGGQTRELIKGVAAGRGHGAFQGRIVVRPQAQKTDAHQVSRNLLIGRRAAIDTKPELEIEADDVKCSHGASIGDLDEAALFYLRARGIPDGEARRMLIEGFLREAVEGVGDAAIRDYLQRRLAARLANLEGSR